jgi:hypothetical protein
METQKTTTEVTNGLPSHMDVDKETDMGQHFGHVSVAVALLHIIRQHGHGTQIIMPLSHIVLHIAAFAFFDDTDIIQTKPCYNHSTDEIEHKVFLESQEALDHWGSTLACTGGALEPAKSFYMYINPTWKGPNVCLGPHDKKHELMMNNVQGQRISLQNKRQQKHFSH